MAKIIPIDIIKGVSDNWGGRRSKVFSFCSSLTLHYFAVAKLGCGSEEKMKFFRFSFCSSLTLH